MYLAKVPQGHLHCGTTSITVHCKSTINSTRAISLYKKDFAKFK